MSVNFAQNVVPDFLSVWMYVADLILSVYMDLRPPLKGPVLNSDIILSFCLELLKQNQWLFPVESLYTHNLRLLLDCVVCY